MHSWVHISCSRLSQRQLPTITVMRYYAVDTLYADDHTFSVWVIWLHKMRHGQEVAWMVLSALQMVVWIQLSMTRIFTCRQRKGISRKEIVRRSAAFPSIMESSGMCQRYISHTRYVSTPNWDLLNIRLAQNICCDTYDCTASACVCVSVCVSVWEKLRKRRSKSMDILSILEVPYIHATKDAHNFSLKMGRASFVMRLRV